VTGDGVANHAEFAASRSVAELPLKKQRDMIQVSIATL